MLPKQRETTHKLRPDRVIPAAAGVETRAPSAVGVTVPHLQDANKSAPSPSPLSERPARKEAEGLSKHIHQLRVGTLFGSEFKQTILKMMEQWEQCGRWRFTG